MFENDYLMRIIWQMVEILRRSWGLARQDPRETAEEIEHAIGEAVDIDHRLLFSMTPESMVSMLQLGTFNEKLGGYVLRSMYYEATLLEEAGQPESADLRRSQADAIAQAYGYDITPADATPEALEAFFNGEGEGGERQAEKIEV